MSRSNAYIVILAAGVLLGLAGCGSRPYYSDIPEPEVPEPGARVAVVQPQTNVYTVKSGDTLHSIAFAAGTDWSRLARLNGISAPYTIYPGQSLKLYPGSASRPSSSASRPAASSAPKATPSAPAPVAAAPASSGFPWRWPADGALVGQFVAGEATKQGIDIAGKAGQPVLAAADGKVVYSGSGLRGYGKLIILRHDKTYLSAYAHNNQLLVKEGQAVKKGQKIAEMGNTDADQVKLHFEIRQLGKPVDPSKYLETRP